MSSISNLHRGLLPLRRGLAFAGEGEEVARRENAGNKSLVFICAQTLGADAVEDLTEPPSIGLVVGIVPELHELFSRARRNNKTIVLCAENPGALTRVVALLGSVMILVENCSVEKVIQKFLPVSDRLTRLDSSSRAMNGAESTSVSLADVWKALFRAFQLGWIRFTTSPQGVLLENTGSFYGELHEHYSCQLNGGIHIIVPGKLVCFATPSGTLSNDAPYVDVPERNQRIFSAKYIADLLGETGHFGEVSVVLGIYREDASESDRISGPFTARGMATEDLMQSGCSGLLRTVDRLISNVAGAPGTVAIHTSSTALGSGRVGEIVATFLVRHLGFEVDSALAWIHMVRAWQLLGGKH